jgi:hypothetical protein
MIVCIAALATLGAAYRVLRPLRVRAQAERYDLPVWVYRAALALRRR